MHNPDKSMVKQNLGSLQKSESNKRFFLTKNEQKHPLENAGPGTKLIHYSPEEGLEELNPMHHGKRGIGAEAKQGQPVHPTTFFYLEGTEPENIVTSGSKYKYVASKGNMKFYDLANDHANLRQRAKQLAEEENLKSKYPNPPGSAISRREHMDQAIRESGYHGFYNSSLNDTMRNVVAVYDKVPVDKYHRLHPNDFKEASARDHHADDARMDRTHNFSKEHGHHNPRFLYKLTEDEDNG